MEGRKERKEVTVGMISILLNVIAHYDFRPSVFRLLKNVKLLVMVMLTEI